MPFAPLMDDLLEYTAWQRRQWLDWLRQHDAAVLKTGAGAGGDGRFESAGDWIKHIFSAEKRYVERMLDRPLTDPAAIPSNNLEELFQFGERSRRELKEFVEALPAAQWDAPMELTLMGNSLTATPKKIVTHVLLHEIRHWAQIATLLRLSGYKVDLHDFIFSPVMGGELRRAPRPA